MVKTEQEKEDELREYQSQSQSADKGLPKDYEEELNKSEREAETKQDFAKYEQEKKERNIPAKGLPSDYSSELKKAERELQDKQTKAEFAMHDEKEKEQERLAKIERAAKEGADKVKREQESKERGTTAHDFAKMAAANKDKKPYEPMTPINRKTLSDPHKISGLMQKAGNYANENIVQPFARGAVGTRTQEEKKAGMRPISILEKVGADYRADKKPKFVVGKATAPSPVSRPAGPSAKTMLKNTGSAIDFGRTSFGGNGLAANMNSPFQFNTPLFGAAPEEQKRQKKRRR